MLDRDILLDFVTHPEWSLAYRELQTLISSLLDLAARAKRDEHEYERGRLAGAERALAVLDNWRKVTKEELTKRG